MLMDGFEFKLIYIIFVLHVETQISINVYETEILRNLLNLSLNLKNMLLTDKS